MQFLRILRYLDAVARTGSIRSAASQLNVVSSAVTRRILDLETELGTKLFERRAKGVQLTAAGQLYLRFARSTLSEAEAVRSQIEDLSNLRTGHVNLWAISAVANELTSGDVLKFRTAYPAITFSVTIAGSEDVVRAVTENEADCGIAFNPPPNPEFVRLAEKRQILCAVMQRQHPLARRKKLRLADCHAYPIAMPDSSWSGRRMLDELAVRSGMPLKASIEANSFEILAAFTRQSHGICFQIRSPASSHEIMGDLIALPLVEFQHLETRLVLGCRKGRNLPIAVAAFCDQLKKSMFSGRRG